MKAIDAPLEQLAERHVDGTQVTARGLKPLVRCRRLAVASLDSRQLDDRVAAQRAAHPALRNVILVGPQVTDTHLRRLHALSGLQDITLTRTAATRQAILGLEEALPQCGVLAR